MGSAKAPPPHVPRPPRLYVLVLLAAGLLAYANSFGGALLYDDLTGIVKNALVHHPLANGRNLLTTLRPFTTLTLAVNYAIGGLNPFGYHAVNLAIHLLAGLTLFGLVRRTLLLPAVGERLRGAAGGVALAVALIWLVHPLQTESVTYIIQRHESLMGLFYLLTLYCLLRGATAAGRTPWYALAVICCALGMASKEVMVTAPLVALLYDRAFLAPSWREALRRRWGPYLALAATWLLLAAPLAVALPQGNPGSAGPPPAADAAPAPAPAPSAGFGMKTITPLEYARSEPGVVLHYLRLAVWPDPLCLDYVWPVARGAAEVLPAAVVLLGLLLATLWAWRRCPPLGFVGAWFFLILAPTSSIMPIADLAVEHRMYLPLAAVVVLAVLGGYAVLVSPGRGRAAAPSAGIPWMAAVPAALAVVVLAGLTCRRNRAYESERTMWSDVAAQRPENPRAHHNLGNALSAAGRVDEAIGEYRQAIRLKPDYAEAYNDLGTALAEKGRLDDALPCHLAALRLDPRLPLVHNNLGRIYIARHDLDNALACFRQELEISPDNPAVLQNLGSVLALRGRPGDAVPFLERATRLTPGDAGAHYNLGLTFARAGKAAAAVRELAEAVRLNPAYHQAYDSLGNALLDGRRPAEAVDCFRKAVALKGDSVKYRCDLALALTADHRPDAAAGEYRQALRLNPNWPREFSEAARRLAAGPGAGGPDIHLALRLAQEACQATGGREPEYLDALAAAQAEEGRLDEAASTARQAATLAAAAGKADLARDIRERLRRYEHGRAARDDPPRAGS